LGYGGLALSYNLLIITPDQLRADYLGCYGNNNIGTANIDKLASEGVVFDNCYCAAPLCAPSRISFATSTYVGEHNRRNYGTSISPDVPNLISKLKEQGYQTGMFGKNHLFTNERLDEVWDVLDEICLGNYEGHPGAKQAFSSFEMEIDHPFNITARLTDETIDFMNSARKPFVAWVNYQDPHPAFTCPKPYYDMFSHEDIVLSNAYYEYDKDRQPIRNQVWRKHSQMDQCSEENLKSAIATYMGQVRYIDHSVGQLLSSLKLNKLDNNTVVLFFSDHGELLGDYGMTHKLPVFYDCLTKIPTILRHPDLMWAGTRFTGLVEEVDLAPTLLDMLNISIPATMVGESLFSSLNKNDLTGKETALCEAGAGAPTWKEPGDGMILSAPHAPTSFGPGAMLRYKSWKLSMYSDDLCELYNLEDDPDELDNLYDNPKYRDIQERMTTLLLKRILGVKVRDIGLDWDENEYPIDVRFNPLECIQ
jgi:arylsulfatase A-like enzyme